MNRTILHLMVLAMGVVAMVNDASAQNIERMRGLLAADGNNGGKVVVLEDSNAKSAILAVDSKAKKSEVSGYRVVLFNDSAQYAQDRANGIMKAFKKLFPEINSYLVYESPYFKVSVGDCLTMEEAIMLRNRVLEKFPDAFIRRDKVTLKTLTNVRRRVDCLKLDPDVRESLLHSRELRDKMRKDETMYIVMQRDEELNKLLLLDDIASDQNKGKGGSEEDPEWIDEW